MGIAETGEEAHGDVSVGEAIAEFIIGTRVGELNATEVEALFLDVLAQIGDPGGEDHGRLVADVATDIVVGTVVLASAEELEIATPVVVPALGQVLVTEVLEVDEVILGIGIEASASTEVEGAESRHLLLPLGIELPALVVEVGVEDTLDGALVVDGDEGATIEPWQELKANVRGEAAIDGGHVVGAHGGLVEGCSAVVGDTCLDVEPVEEHDVVEGLQVGVLELVDIRLVEVDGVVIAFCEHILHAGVADGVAVTPDNLCITIALRVVGHTEGGGEVELRLLEVITEGGVEREITVLVPGVARAEFHLVAKSTGVAIAEVKGIDDGRETDGGIVRLGLDGGDEVVANGVPENLLPETGLLGEGIGSLMGLLDAIVGGIDLLILQCEGYGTDEVHHLFARQGASAIGQGRGTVVIGIENGGDAIAHELEGAYGAASLGGERASILTAQFYLGAEGDHVVLAIEHGDEDAASGTLHDGIAIDELGVIPLGAEL